MKHLALIFLCLLTFVSIYCFDRLPSIGALVFSLGSLILLIVFTHAKRFFPSQESDESVLQGLSCFHPFKGRIERWINSHCWLMIKRWLGPVLLIGLFLVEFFVTKIGIDEILIVLAVFALIRGESVQFFRDWFPPMMLFYAHIIYRAKAYSHVAVPLGIKPINEPLIWLERKIFFFWDEVPPLKIRQWIKGDSEGIGWYDYAFFLFYTIFYWYWIVVAYVLWSKKREYFKPYIYGLMGFALFDTLIYAFFPTAPPWWAAENGFIPAINRIIWSVHILPENSLEMVSAIGGNDFAAVPSHHAAWPFFGSLFLLKAFGKKALPYFAIPLLIAFTTWYGGEHYIIDSIAGFLVAYAAYWVALHWKKPKTPPAVVNG